VVKAPAQDPDLVEATLTMAIKARVAISIAIMAPAMTAEALHRP
jgi:hypothetical protein